MPLLRYRPFWNRSSASRNSSRYCSPIWFCNRKNNMAVQDLLSQDEIDALLHGVDEGIIDSEQDSEPGGVRSYDLTSQDRIVRGRMPTLEMINERFARYTRI